MINRYFLLIFIILLYNKCDVETNTVDSINLTALNNQDSTKIELGTFVFEKGK